jgi:hypothetical protein
MKTVRCFETSVEVYQTARHSTTLFLNILINPSLRLADNFNHVTSNFTQIHPLFSPGDWMVNCGLRWARDVARMVNCGLRWSRDVARMDIT